MSIGIDILRSVVNDRSTINFQKIKREWLINSQEENLYDFIREHINNHSTVPSIDTLRENGFHARSVVSEEFSYYENRLRKRVIFNILNSEHESFINAMNSRDVDLAASCLQEMLAGIYSVNTGNEIIHHQNSFTSVMEEHDDAFFRGDIKGITLGYDYLDQLTQGAQGGDVIVIVARPGMGKSYLLLNMAKVAWESGRSCMIGSMEMSNEQLSKRLLSIVTGIPTLRFTQGRLGTLPAQYVRQTIEETADMPPLNFIGGKFRKSVLDIERMIRETSPQIAYIDAAYLLQPENKKKFTPNRREAIADVIEGIKAVASNTNIPIVVTVQFNRTVKKGKKVEIDLDAIGETDTIGQIASIVLGIQEGRQGYEKEERRISLIKNREGEDGKFVVNFKFDPLVNFDFICEYTEDVARNTTEEENENIADML